MKGWDTMGPPGSDFKKVEGDRGGYTFHLQYEHHDLNLAQKVEATIHEQMNDPSFRAMWTFYESRNIKCRAAYDAHLVEMDRKEREQDGVYTVAA